ncbi:N-acetylgalactosamine-N,N'-diacetylbacillosaminyl-diphospho-undecaprenol 4-alpha-N-acetylgalactosaminyltransferase [Yoonia maricola]|uniref:N-acetylgalactosamine-N, N'-diacetylbacillosaminyl-diphospho-undecaprenol 4-alpha-N-acetylgalactosaminyltransferase n=1 Tax=Yoonia maricola TaxID=420999 RepID=A0A2M8WP21_9RHOB|nr:glycosyltransferase [Yoonia maricola]PJI92677.1 N-acetylgalactosamine-N,N'-diacetylbacillosaminyl-diphospho-undecaprenol 4-alpha-N-acetylgalactosaminyltransferase [Yoonia maricola]
MKGQADLSVSKGGNAPGPRVSFLINSMEGGGAERAMANLLGHLQPHFINQTVELILLDDMPMQQELPDYLNVVTLDGRGKMGRSLSQLRRHWGSATHRPDVCVSYLARANVVNIWLARRFGHRAVISERVHTSSHLAGSRAGPVLKWITSQSYPRADHVIAVSAGVSDDLSSNYAVPKGKISVIGNPIDAVRLQTLAAEQPTIALPEDYFLGVGRLVPNKNFALTLAALAAVPDAPKLVILGHGPQETALRAQAEQLGIAERVIFAGFLENPYPIMARARALVSASRAEGFPNTLIEAMTLGCPVIATDCPSGPAEVLEMAAATAPPWPATAHGILVPMEHQQAMAAGIKTLCDKSTRDDYATRATQRAAHFGHKAVVAAYTDIFNAVHTP